MEDRLSSPSKVTNTGKCHTELSQQEVEQISKQAVCPTASTALLSKSKWSYVSTASKLHNIISWSEQKPCVLSNCYEKAGQCPSRLVGELFGMLVLHLVLITIRRCSTLLVLTSARCYQITQCNYRVRHRLVSVSQKTRSPYWRKVQVLHIAQTDNSRFKDIIVWLRAEVAFVSETDITLRKCGLIWQRAIPIWVFHYGSGCHVR